MRSELPAIMKQGCRAVGLDVPVVCMVRLVPIIYSG
jgi:hypothetical protein